MSFSADLQRFQRRTMEKYAKVYRLSALDLFSAVVMETPVDKGVLRNNWFASIGQGSGDTTSSGDASGQGTISRINTMLMGADGDQDVFLTNNLPYAAVVEFGGYPNPAEGGEGKTSGGFSLKAPGGMVRINARNWNRIVKRNLRSVARAR